MRSVLSNFHLAEKSKRLFQLSLRQITMAEIKRRKLETMRKSGTFAEDPTGDKYSAPNPKK